MRLMTGNKVCRGRERARKGGRDKGKEIEGVKKMEGVKKRRMKGGSMNEGERASQGGMKGGRRWGTCI